MDRRTFNINKNNTSVQINKQGGLIQHYLEKKKNVQTSAVNTRARSVSQHLKAKTLGSIHLSSQGVMSPAMGNNSKSVKPGQTTEFNIFRDK